MSGKENKRSRGRRTLNNQAKATSNATSANNSAPLSQSQIISMAKDIPLNCEVPADFTFRSSREDAEKITELMDAPLDFDIPDHAISKGPNPYLDRCMYCNTPRTMVQEGDEGTEFLDLQLDGNPVITGQTNAPSFGSLKLEIWTCPTCRKVAGNFQSFLEANLPQAACEETILQDPLHQPCISSFSCTECEDESGGCREVHAQETKELQRNWVELRTIVKDLHTCNDEPALSHENGEQLKFLIEKLCQKDPHQLFLRLESQVREMVIEIKTGLLEKLNANGIHNPALALDFTSTLLCHYDLITKKAHLLAQYLGGLTDHLKQFQVTWELLNKHLFHSIAHNDPAISSVGPTILEQLRQGSLQFERSREDPFCNVRKRLLKFQEEMSVVVVVWRDCQQLIENYCQEEFTNTQKQVSHRAKNFITQQRQLLKNHLMKDSFMDEETMKNLVSGHKSPKEKVLCHRCKRERCTCDECTITHMITCGIINTEKGTTLPPPPSSFNFALDHTHNVMDITPPSMSSTTSSSGSVSPINVEDKITAYYDCEKVLTEELRDAMLSCDGNDKRLTLDDLIDNIDDNAGDDEDEEDLEDGDNCVDQHNGSDEPHAMQLPLWDTLEAHQLIQNHNSNEHVTLSAHGAVPHSCAQCHQFQPRIDSHLSQQLDAEIANSGVPSSEINDCMAGSDSALDNSKSNGGSVINPNICATCQCHACLKQSGHVISTSLPLQVPVSPPPAELNLYPHIHGLPPQRYMFGLPSPLLPSIKLPFKLDFDDPASIHDHLYHAYSDWDNPRPGSLAAQHQHQSHHRFSSDLLPPAPVVDAVPAFSFEALSLTTHNTQTLTNTSSAFKSIAGKNGESFLSNINGCGAEGSSVDPTTKPPAFPFTKISQSCLNSTSLSLPVFSSSVPSAMPPSIISNLPVTTSVSASKSVNGSCHGPPSSRPVPLGGNTATTTSKWEKTHSLQCKKFTASGPSKFALLNQNGDPVNPFSATNLQLATPLSMPQSTASSKNLLSNQHIKSLRTNMPCPHSSQSPPVKPNESPSLLNQCQASNLTSVTADANAISSPSFPPSSLPTSCLNANVPSTIVNNIGVGTTTPCVDVECKVHHEDNCDSVDDSCSERSSSTSSNQKEGKYCDCCYCEFFGHNNPQGPKTSPNYLEIKDRLRKKLKKKNESKPKSVQVQGPPQVEGKKAEQPKVAMEKRGLDELLNFINGTDESSRNKTTNNKAAKRARQKQRKLEEKARQGNSTRKCEENHRHHEVPKSIANILLKSPLGMESCGGSDHLHARPDRGATPTDEERIKELHKKLALLKEEMNQETTRSSIIESDRRTISRSPGPKNGNNFDKVLDMIHQTLKHGVNNGKKRQSAPNPPITNNSKPLETKNVLSAGKEQQPVQQTKQIGKQQHVQNNQSPQPSRTSQVQKMGDCVVYSPNQVKSMTCSGDKKSTMVSNIPNIPNAHTSSNSSNGLCPAKLSSTNGHGSLNMPSSLHGLSSSKLSCVTNGNEVISSKASSDSTNTSNISNGPSSVKTATMGLGSSKASTASSNSYKGPTVSTALPVAKGVSFTATGSHSVTSTVSSPSKAIAVNSSGSPKSGKSSDSSVVKVHAEPTKPASGKSKKNKKKNKTENGDVHDPEGVFMPKSESELNGAVDDFERELEEFKRFCYETSEPKEKRKLAVNVNLKDIFKKKSTFA